MSSANQNNSLLRTVTSLTLLGGIAASFAWACVSSSSDNKGTGGAAGETGGSASVGGGAGSGNTNVGGNSAGGNNGTGGAPLAGCPAPDAGVVTGHTCTFNPATPTWIPDSSGTQCSFGTWGNDGTMSGLALVTYPATLVGSCTDGTLHITGTYIGSETGGGAVIFTPPASDAGPGCQLLDASAHTGLQVTLKATSLPNNLFGLGFDILGKTNSAQRDLTFTPDGTVQTVKIPWTGTTGFKNNKSCGVVNKDISGLWFYFSWFSASTPQTVDVNVISIGAYD